MLARQFLKAFINWRQQSPIMPSKTSSYDERLGVPAFRCQLKLVGVPVKGAPGADLQRILGVTVTYSGRRCAG